MTTAPQSKPLLMSGPLVVASLAGLKTQTRRVIVPQPPAATVSCSFDPSSTGGWMWADSEGKPIGAHFSCPYGKPGDRLWVRENWRTYERPSDGVDGIKFAADGAFVPIANNTKAADAWVDAHNNGKHGKKWRPSIHMPRWASRLTLEITGVRVERVQSISESDARAEGISSEWSDDQGETPGRDLYFSGATRPGFGHPRAREAFADLWDSLATVGCKWPDNPWTWALTYKVVSPAVGAEGGGG